MTIPHSNALAESVPLTSSDSRNPSIGLFGRLNLGIKASLLIFLVLAVLLGSVVVLLRDSVEQLINNIGQEELREETIAIQVQFEHLQSDLLITSRLLAETPALLDIVTTGNQAAFDELLASDAIGGQFTDMDIFTKTGRRLFDMDEDSSPEALSDAEQSMALSALRGDTLMTVLAEDDRLRLTTAVPIRAPGSISGAGVLINSIALDEVFLNNLALDSDHVALHLIHQGEIVVSRIPDEVSELQAATAAAIAAEHDHAAENDSIAENDHEHDHGHMDPHAMAALLDREALARAREGDIFLAPEHITLHNAPHALAHMPLTINDAPMATVAVVVGLEDIVAFEDEFISSLTVLFVILGLGAMGLMYWAIRFTIIGPLRNVQSVADEMARGNYRQRVEVRSRDEIGRLGQAFNSMAQGLGNLYNSLEEKIAERTNQLEAALTEARAARGAAEEASKMKSQFLANMSHELRTPLNSIINFTYMLRNGVYGEVSARQSSYLERVQGSGEHLLSLINDILDLSKIEAGRLELFSEPVDLQKLITSAMSTAVGLTKDHPVTLEQDIAADLATVTADPTRVRQILLNLLSNAAKFTETGSITVRAVNDGNQVVISVVDTGIGIPADKLDTIFEEFRQADEGSARSFQGTGLGLAICRKLVRMHGGKIWVESTVGVGSTFFFSLPLDGKSSREAIAGPAVPMEFESNAANGPRILVIDNDLSAIEIVQSYLQRDGYQVRGCLDSRHALTETRSFQPDLIILDILMPYQDGWEVLTELKADPELNRIPVLLYTIVEDEERGLRLGASAYLAKPIEPHVLRQTVQRLVTHSGRILVVDDDPTVLEMVTDYLSNNGYEVRTAQGGQAGLDAIAADRPDLLILDLMMPEVDGFNVLARLAEAETGRTLPVIVLSARDLSREERDYLNQHARVLLGKGSTSFDQLLVQVTGIVHSGQRLVTT